MPIKAILSALMLLAFVITVSAVMVQDGKHKLRIANLENSALKSEVLAQQQSIDRLSASLMAADKMLAKAIKERDLQQQLHKAQLAEKERLQGELDRSREAVNTLRQSHDQSVKDWANTAMPADAVRLLKFAKPAESDNQHHSSASAGLSDPAAKPIARLPANQHF